MKNRYIFPLIFLLFLAESTLFPWIFPLSWRPVISLTPHFALAGVLFVGVFRNRHQGLLYGLIFGFMHDIVHASPMIGAHAFCMALAGYGAGAAADRMKITLVKTVLVMFAALLFYDWAIYALYRFFRVTFMPFSEMITDFWLPTVLFNLLFIVSIYVPARKLLEGKQDKREEESSGV
jgi:rod shape-determining protein MreD